MHFWTQAVEASALTFPFPIHVLWIRNLITPPCILKIVFWGLSLNCPVLVFWNYHMHFVANVFQHVSILFWCSIRCFQNASCQEMDSNLKISLKIVKILKIFPRKRNVKKKMFFEKWCFLISSYYFSENMNQLIVCRFTGPLIRSPGGVL